MLKTSLQVNCGFARVGIRELSKIQQGSKRSGLDFNHIEAQFRMHFDIPSFQVPENLFLPDSRKQTPFKRRCIIINDVFSKSWSSTSHKTQYMEAFSLPKWETLPSEQKSQHTLSNCVGCYIHYGDMQNQFPLKPTYNPDSSVEVTGGSEIMAARRVLRDANREWEKEYGHTLTDVLPKLCPEANLTTKKSKQEQKQESRTRMRKLTTHVNKQMEKNAAVTMLASGESFAQYHRKRMMVSFETPSDTSPGPPKKRKSHSPSQENFTWDTQAVLTDLAGHPEGVAINWSRFAREHNVPGKNAGQVVKEYAQTMGFDTYRLDQRSDSTPKRRPTKNKLPGMEISAPCMPPVHKIQEKRDKMIENGEIYLGEPIAPYSLTRFRTENGKVLKYTITIEGRKTPLIKIREKMLKQQEQYMHLYTDTEIASLTEDDLRAFLKRNHITQTLTKQEMQQCLAKVQRNRTLICWHDHAKILGTGYLLITINAVYDTAIFMTEEEYHTKYRKEVTNLQAVIEQPHIYIIAAGSSSAEDQATIIPDRIECLHDLTQVIKSSNGTEITDTLRFFKGDAPAKQFERGTQIGGNYKCGSCGCHSDMFEDLAHTLQLQWHSLSDLQQTVLAGKYGDQANTLKPFETLDTPQLQEELRKRNILHTATTKKDCSAILTGILKGVQRVATLLMSSPSQSLSSLHLENYEVLDSEPLHDLKGHLSHLFVELPFILNGDTKDTCCQIISCYHKKEKVTCADLRLTAIHIYLCLVEKLAHSDERVLLLETVVHISQILYLPATERTPRRVLQLYNLTWIHHMLCSKLFSRLHKVTRNAFFGLYLHHLVVHAPQQYEIVSQSSVNTEAEERLFGQAKQLVIQASNRHADNVIFNILVRLQAKELIGQNSVLHVLKDQYCRVKKAAANVSSYQRTIVKPSLIESSLHSWQEHLKRISPYLVVGEGIWWSMNNGDYHFHDGDNDPEGHEEGPDLLHFRDTQLNSFHTRNEKKWEEIIEKKINLPTRSIRIYNQRGSLIERRIFTHQNLEETDLACSTDSSVTQATTPGTTSTLAPLSDCQLVDSHATQATTTPTLAPLTLSDCRLVDSPVAQATTPGSTPTLASLTLSGGGQLVDSHATQATTTPTLAPLTLSDCRLVDSPSTQATTIGTTSTLAPLSLSGGQPDLALDPHVTQATTDYTISDTHENDRTEIHTDLELQTTAGELKTKMAIAVLKIVGMSQELVDYDNMRATLKDKSQRTNKAVIMEHNRVQTYLKTQVLKESTDIKEKMFNFEKHFYAKNKRLPKVTDDEDYSMMTKKLKFIKHLLSEWNITC